MDGGISRRGALLGLPKALLRETKAGVAEASIAVRVDNRPNHHETPDETPYIPAPTQTPNLVARAITVLFPRQFTRGATFEDPEVLENDRRMNPDIVVNEETGEYSYSIRREPPRRRFLKQMVIATAVLVGSSIVNELGRAVKVAQAVGKLAGPEHKEDNSFGTGTIEAEVIRNHPSIDFFDKQGGHNPWLGAALEDNQVVRDVCQEMIRNMRKNPGALNFEGIAKDETKYNSIGKTLEQFERSARINLKRMYPTYNPSDEEVLHLAVISLAAVMNNTTTFKQMGFEGQEIEDIKRGDHWAERVAEMKKFGFTDEQIEDLRKGGKWSETGFARNYFPALFPGFATEAGDEAFGRDRSMHFFNHMFLGFEILYCAKYDLPTGNQISAPIAPIIGPLLDAARSMGGRAVTWFTRVMGYAYEVSTTKSWPDFIKGETSLSSSGLNDSEYKYDLAANKFGALCGVAMMKGHYKEVIAMLKDRRLLMQTDKPQIPPEIYNRLIFLAQ